MTISKYSDFILWLRINDEWWYHNVYDNFVIIDTIMTNELGCCDQWPGMVALKKSRYIFKYTL